MQQPCPLCKKYIETSRNSETVCETCKSTIYTDNEDNPGIVESGMSFNILNFIFGLIFLFGSIYLIALKFIDNFRILYIGLVFTLAPISMILRALLFYVESHDGILGLYSAIFDKRIVHYDSASKFMIYLLVIIQCLGLLFLIIGSLFKI